MMKFLLSYQKGIYRKFLLEILDADWLEFATLLLSILRNNKFCFCLAQKILSRRNVEKEEANWTHESIPTAQAISNPDSLGVKCIILRLPRLIRLFDESLLALTNFPAEYRVSVFINIFNAIKFAKLVFLAELCRKFLI